MLRPSLDWLQDSDRRYPVTVDPDIPATPVILGDTYYADGTDANTSFSSQERLEVGYFSGKRQRSFVSFAYNSYLGTVVTSASLGMKQYYADTCATKPTQYHSMTGGDGPSLTWNDQPDYSDDKRFKTSKSFNRGASGCAAGIEDVDVTNIVNGWAGRHIGPHAKPKAQQDVYLNRQAIIMRAADEADTTQYKKFCSRHWSAANASCSTAAVIPKLSLNYRPELGVQSWYSMTNHSFNDKSSLSVNNRNGNAVVQSSDIEVNGIGLNLNISRTYNSQASVTNTTLGKGWGLSIGPDIWLEKRSEYRYDFHGPSGTVLGSFVRKSDDTGAAAYKQFTAPIGGVGADLEETSAGNFTLKFRKSQSKYVFAQVDSAGHAYMTKVKDRSDNEITIAYSGTTANGRPKMSSITDASSRTYAVTYDVGNTVITKIATTNVPGVGVRDWDYEYDSGRLIGFTDARNDKTTYSYYSGGELQKVTSPSTTAGGSETELVYNGTGQAVEVYYRHNSGANDRYKYTWDYSDTIVADCESNGNSSTVVTDPNEHMTTYCYRKRDDTTGDVKVWVYDARGKVRSTEYSADNGPTNITTPTGVGTGPTGSTAINYSDDFTDRADEITEPKSSGAGQGASTGMEYNTGGTVPGKEYLPSAVRTSTRDCNRYGYDGKGRTSVAYTGVTANALGECGASGPSSNEFHTDYNDNGTVDETWDANAEDSPGNNGAEPSADDKTLYTYWQTGDTGYVAGTAWQVKTIRRPGGSCVTGTGRKLCTSYTYDGAARIKTITDGRGIVTTYNYDVNDRTTHVLYNGSNDFSCVLTIQATCTTYAYDAEGNLTQRAENSANTTFTYDRLNRMKSQTVQTDTLGVDIISMGYDGVGNLIEYNQTLNGAATTHQVDYAYNVANQLSKVTHGGNEIDIDVDDDGRTKRIKFPDPTSTGGSMVDYDYAESGKPKDVILRTHAETEVGKISYDYTKEFSIDPDGPLKPLPVATVNVDVPQMQSRQVHSGAAPVSDQVGTTEYTYSGQRLTKAEDSNGPNHLYEYDKVGNITEEVAGSSTTRFGYNRAGELCWRGPNTGTKLNRACPTTPAGNTSLSQDAAGNSLGTTGNTYTVSDRNQVTNVDGVAQGYLDQGNDIRRTTGSIRETTGPLGVTAYRNGSNFTYLVRDPSGMLLSASDGTYGIVNYITEPNGNVSFIVAPWGYRVGAYKYAPYGKTTAYGAAAEANRYRWLGAAQNYNPSGGDGQHYKLGARYYDTQGHFTQADPLAGGLGDPRTLTRYNYAGGDPINQADPSGRAFTDFVKEADFVKAIDVFGRAAAGLDLAMIGYHALNGNPEAAAAKTAGLLAGVVVGGICSPAATTGIGAIGCFGLAGAAGAATEELTKEALS